LPVGIVDAAAGIVEANTLANRLHEFQNARSITAFEEFLTIAGPVFWTISFIRTQSHLRGGF
jgi:hypothetical protein